MIQVPTTVATDVRRALDEDIRTGDVTADLIPADADGHASVSYTHLTLPTTPYV